ncbi:MAG: segregation/condensation protein A [Chloroflexota bacterium]|nr:segregation/condensation protein A [Chloroflexota bacterium]
MPYTVTLPLFEGPLDLLLHLIEKKELDVTKVALAAVTVDYLRTIREMQQIDPDHVADFLVIAARLLLIKSSMLLPVEQPDESEEDEGEALAQTLEIYRQYKQVATHLLEREAERLRSYARVAPPLMERHVVPNGTSLCDLFGALQKVLEEKEPEPESVDKVVQPLRITVRQRIRELTTQLRCGEPVEFVALLSKEPSRQEVIATFLAMLELLKLGWTRVVQDSLWGEIKLLPLLEAMPEGEAHDPTAEIDEYI